MKQEPVKHDLNIHYGADTSGCPVESLPDLIRKRAYQLYELRGKEPGHELDDWLRAEEEITRCYRP